LHVPPSPETVLTHPTFNRLTAAGRTISEQREMAMSDSDDFTAMNDPDFPAEYGRVRDIVVFNLGVSKQHAELRRSPTGGFTILDLGSHYGTYVNGTRVSQQELNEGDILAIGHATFRLTGGELIEDVDDGRSPG
jgi:hypothetical protein